MGVPKFYRWISERYPCLSEVVKEHQIPEFDNLYLDMNGIIHQCSHPNDEDVHFRISEEKIFADIFHYLEVLFRIIKPRKVFFMAVDGVAPRAKMNQQRGRRFRSAKEAEEKIKKALEKGEVLPTEARFDSNCITPGTDFMARLQEQLKYFVHNKLSTDKAWQGVNVYLSGHETPGEGEHKIMEFIRSETTKLGHTPNTRHCLYGLDADLIMLGLTSHEPNFSLLREEVRFGGKKSQKRITAPEETTFHLLHLSLMREYIDYEFSELRNKISFEYDLERIIDDWVLMGFLVGNDFIPHLPHLHINHDALPLLYRTYISVLPSLGGYLNENGHLNLAHFEKYLEKLSDFDREHFSEVFVDLKWFESKVGNKYLNEAAGLAAEEAGAKDMKKSKSSDDSLCLAALDGVRDSHITPGRGEDGEDDDMFETEFRQYKRTYYMTKMGVEVVSDEFLANQARCYVEGIQWILHYYYHGVQSWSWYYPHHYAPFLSDVRNVSSLTLTFDLGKPFMPFEQLLGVLPSASKDLLPRCYQHLMTSPGSPIVECYPQDFKTDLNGKQQEWEAVVLIPFIDEKCLLAAMEPYTHKLAPSEKARNRHTECAINCFDKELDYAYNSPLPQLFPNIVHCHVRQTPIPMDAWRVSLDHVARRIDRGALYFCGFPTLQHIRHKFYKKKSGVMVFQQSSRGENMILEILASQEMEQVEDVATLVLGKTLFVNWPHLMEARVVAVSDGETKFSLDEPSGSQMLYLGNTPPPAKVTHLTDKEQKEWVKEVQGLSEHFSKRKGTVINETDVVVYAQLLTGRKYVIGQNGNVHLEKQFAKQVLPYPYQTIVKDIKAFDSSLARFKTLEELFPPGTVVFMVANPYYGAMGDVQDSSDVINEGRVRVVFSVPCEPQLDALIQSQHKYSVKYCPGYVLASRLGITSYLVSRFSGSIFIGRGSKKNPHGEQKANVGLNLKFNKKNEEVPGYTKRTEKEWLYSAAVEDLLAEYLERFSELFDFVARNSHDDVFYEDDIWPGEDENGAEKVQEIQGWLKNHPVSSSSRASCDLQILDAGIVEKIEEELEKTKVVITYKPQQSQYLFLSFLVVNVIVRQCFIRIWCVCRCSPGRGYRLPPSALINLSHGSRGQQKLASQSPQPEKPTQGMNCLRLIGLTALGIVHDPLEHFSLCSSRALVMRESSVMYGRLFRVQELNVLCLSAARINTPQTDAPAAAPPPPPPPPAGQPPLLPSMATELGRICMGLGMGPPEFAFLRNRQSLTVCQVKLSNGLLIHGPQCQSETEAKEKAALFALQRLNSLGSFPLPPPIFPGVQQMRPLAPHPSMFGQPAGLSHIVYFLLNPVVLRPLHWGMRFPHQGQPFYGGTFPGARAPVPSAASGSHNQFVPLQVTKKRVSGRTKNQEAKQMSGSSAYAGQTSGGGPAAAASAPVPASAPKTPPPISTHEPADKPTTPKTPRQNTNPHTPGSASKRKHRKLAVNFEAAKVTD
uniref:5'-3' exoribonuclease 1 n=1 Tax=Sinocyclocheilus anshuiensis TaxID=1608454 RepID=A0A671RYU7_9TELE